MTGFKAVGSKRKPGRRKRPLPNVPTIAQRLEQSLKAKRQKKG